MKKCLLGLTECPPDPAAGRGKAVSSLIGPTPGGWDEVEGVAKGQRNLTITKAFIGSQHLVGGMGEALCRVFSNGRR